MRVGSLFSGIGGLELGLERAGMQVVWQCDIDEFCRKVLKKHWPGIHCYEDVREIDETAPAIDLLCGGFPCQPHSVAGKRRGADDERNLWPECIRLVRLLRPDWCLFENVPGLLTTMFREVCDQLRGASYEVWPLVLGADDVGAPHRRKRVWIVANNKSQRSRTRGAESEDRKRELEFIGNGTSMVHTERNRYEGGNTEAWGGARPIGFSSEPDMDDARSTESRRLSNSKRQEDTKAGESGEELGNSEDERRQAGFRSHESTWFQTRWPSRPGEPQHDWEAPRLIPNPNARARHGQQNQRNESDQRSDGNAGAETELCREIESGVGCSAHGLSRRLARRRREQLKALGNSVVPLCAEVVGRAIMYADSQTTVEHLFG